MSWKTVNVTGNLLLSPPDDKHTRGAVHSTAFLDPPCNGKVACKLLKTATNSLKQLAERQKEQQLANDEVSELPVNFSTKLQLIWFQGAHTDCLCLRRRVVLLGLGSVNLGYQESRYDWLGNRKGSHQLRSIMCLTELISGECLSRKRNCLMYNGVGIPTHMT